MASQWELQEQWQEFLRTGYIESPVSEEFAKLLAERVARDDHRYAEIVRTDGTQSFRCGQVHQDDAGPKLR